MAVTSELEVEDSLSSSSTVVKIQSENIENSAPSILSAGVPSASVLSAGGSLREPFEIGAGLNVRTIVL